MMTLRTTDIFTVDAAGLNLDAVPYDARFLEKSWTWLQDAETRRLTMTPPFTKQEQHEWFSQLTGRTDYLIWGIELNGEPIGAFGIKNIVAGSGEYWGYIGDKAYRGKGIGKWMMKEAFGRADEQGIGNLYLKVWDGNTRAIKLYETCGFRMQTVEDGVMRMVSDDWR